MILKEIKKLKAERVLKRLVCNLVKCKFDNHMW